MGETRHLVGTGYLLANHRTYIGSVAYSITLSEDNAGTVSITGHFRFTAEPRDVTSYLTLFIQLEDSFYVGITLQQQDLLQNRYIVTRHRPPTQRFHHVQSER